MLAAFALLALLSPVDASLVACATPTACVTFAAARPLDSQRRRPLAAFPAEALFAALDGGRIADVDDAFRRAILIEALLTGVGPITREEDAMRIVRLMVGERSDDAPDRRVPGTRWSRGRFESRLEQLRGRHTAALEWCANRADLGATCRRYALEGGSEAPGLVEAAWREYVGSDPAVAVRPILLASRPLEARFRAQVEQAVAAGRVPSRRMLVEAFAAPRDWVEAAFLRWVEQPAAAVAIARGFTGSARGGHELEFPGLEHRPTSVFWKIVEHGPAEARGVAIGGWSSFAGTPPASAEDAILERARSGPAALWASLALLETLFDRRPEAVALAIRAIVEREDLNAVRTHPPIPGPYFGFRSAAFVCAICSVGLERALAPGDSSRPFDHVEQYVAVWVANRIRARLLQHNSDARVPPPTTRVKLVELLRRVQGEVGCTGVR